MRCEEFRSWVERQDPARTSATAAELHGEPAEHYRSCPACQSLLREEVFWKRFFAAAPEDAPSKSLWPGIASGIQEQTARGESLSTAIVQWGRRLAPAFALFLFLLGGTAVWLGNGVEPEGSDLVPVDWVEPDAVLNQWAGVNGK